MLIRQCKIIMLLCFLTLNLLGIINKVLDSKKFVLSYCSLWIGYLGQ